MSAHLDSRVLSRILLTHMRLRPAIPMMIISIIIEAHPGQA